MVNSSGIQAALYWLVFLSSLIIYIFINQSSLLPWGRHPSPMSLNMVLLYTFTISSIYNVFLIRASYRYIKPQYRQYFTAGRLFDNSLFWLFAAYSLAKAYGFYDKNPFWLSWKTWIMLGAYLLLNTQIQKIILKNKKQTH